MKELVVRVQARARGLLCRRSMRKKHHCATLLQTQWRRYQAALEMKILLYEKLDDLYHARKKAMNEKLRATAALLIQRNVRRHLEYQQYVFLRREKSDADKRISTVIVAIFSAAASIRSFVHPWWRHLPSEVQEVLEQIKASLQRTISLMPVSGKMANEELGRKSARCTAKDLTLDMAEHGPDLATHMLLTVVHHLLSHVPGEIFGPTIKWACYALGHT